MLQLLLLAMLIVGYAFWFAETLGALGFASWTPARIALTVVAGISLLALSALFVVETSVR